MKINTDSSFKFNLSPIRATEEAKKTSSANLPAEKKEAPVSTEGHVFSKTINLSDHFFNKDYENSKYVTGMLDSIKIDNEFRNNMNKMVQQYRLEADKVSMDHPGNMAELALVGQRAERAAKEEAKRYATKKTEKKLEEDRKEREEEQKKKVEEKLSPESSKLESSPKATDISDSIKEKAAPETKADEFKKNETEKDLKTDSERSDSAKVNIKTGDIPSEPSPKVEKKMKTGDMPSESSANAETNIKTGDLPTESSTGEQSQVSSDLKPIDTYV